MTAHPQVGCLQVPCKGLARRTAFGDGAAALPFTANLKATEFSVALRFISFLLPAFRTSQLPELYGRLRVRRERAF